MNHSKIVSIDSEMSITSTSSTDNMEDEESDDEVFLSTAEADHRPECYCLSRHVLTALTFSPRGIILCIARTSRLRLVR